MKNHLTGAPMSAHDKLTAWLELIRFDKPVGTELLLYPTLWALFLASAERHQLPSMKLVAIFALGAFLMRSAGCAINDFADRKVDGQVARTKGRPLADGRLSAKTAAITFVGLSLVAACLLFFLPLSVFYWALVAAVLAFIYPFMKRYTHLPQVVLAAAFGWAIPMAYVAVLGATNVWTWVVFGSYMCWTIAYDTQYAMCDREDDLKAGIKSTAILFGRFDVVIIMALLGVFIVLMGWVLFYHFGAFASLLAPVLGMIGYQYTLIKARERWACFRAFRHNAWVGRYVFVLVLGLCIWAFGVSV